MLINALILFLSVAIPGLLLSGKWKFSETRIKYFLIFAGAYLFSMTVIHLIPDLFMTDEDPFMLGLWILVGFFLQKVLENYSVGVEHGHSHPNQPGLSVTYLILALSVHSFLEGSIMSDTIHVHHMPEAAYEHGSSPKILLGIIMHKIPAAFALMALLVAQVKSKVKASILLLVFALASPLGLISTEYLSHQEIFSEKQMIIFFAIVAGGFLQISTTIFIESDPHHKLNWKRFGVSLIGAGVAVLAQVVI
ncbi:ZIP family metal transporter [Roseivirga pacifica]